jgi:hypothetical protein
MERYPKMKSKMKRIIIGLICLTCVVVVGNILSKEVQGNMREEESQVKEIIGIEGYATYRSEKFGFSFEYPKNWGPPSERTYGNRTIVIITGPRKPKYPPSSLRIETVPSKERGGKYKSLKDYAQYTISDESFKNTNIISDNKTIFKKLKAREISISDQYDYPFRSVEQVPVIYVTKWIIVKNNNYFYKLKYGAIKEEYPKYLEAYERVKETFQFQTPKVVSEPQEIVIMPNETAKPVGLETPFSFMFIKVPLEAVLQFFANMSGLKIILDDEPEGIVTLQGENLTVKESLDKLAKEQNFTYEIKEDAIYIKKK